MTFERIEHIHQELDPESDLLLLTNSTSTVTLICPFKESRYVPYDHKVPGIINYTIMMLEENPFQVSLDGHLPWL